MTQISPKFVFFGTPATASKTLELLRERGITPTLIVTNPDAPKGRGLSTAVCSAGVWARTNSIHTLTPQKLDADAIAEIKSYNCDFAVVVAYGKIFPAELISLFPHGVVNIHYSLLPNYRGASPVETALLHGDTSTGVSIQKMVSALDAGDVLATRTVAIDPLETMHELRPRLIAAGVEVLIEVLPCIALGNCVGTAQKEDNATYAPKIKKQDGQLTLTDDAHTNWNTYRAYVESPGTFFFATRGEKCIRVKIVTATFNDGAFLPTRVIPEGKKEQSYDELVRAQWVAQTS